MSYQLHFMSYELYFMSYISEKATLLQELIDGGKHFPKDLLI